MEMKYYNASNNFRAPIPREPKPYTPHHKNSGEVIVPKPPIEIIETKAPISNECECEDVNNQSLVFTKNRDDLLLIGLILLLLLNQCDDYVLILVLGYLLFCDKK